MKLKSYQWGELIGMLFLLASTAAQLFYVEPLKREIEWRLAAFNMQQNGQVQATAIYDSRIATLKAVNAPVDAIATAEKERATVIEKYKTADANIADYRLRQRARRKLSADHRHRAVCTWNAAGRLWPRDGNARRRQTLEDAIASPIPARAGGEGANHSGAESSASTPP